MSSSRAEILAARFAPTTLEELELDAALRERVDRKYILPWRTFETFAAQLVDSHRVLEVADLRVFTYETTYFDSGSLKTYRDHVMQRRKRFKARSRHYVESDSCHFEVKLKGPRGETIKHRLARDPRLHATLDPVAREFLQSVVIDEYGKVMLEQLCPTLHTDYRRMTLVARHGGHKLTCDMDVQMRAEGDAAAAALAPDHVIVESKAERAGGQAERLLRSLGARPVTCSKYCVGVALTHEGVKTNGFRRLLRRYFTVPAAPVAARRAA